MARKAASALSSAEEPGRRRPAATPSGRLTAKAMVMAPSVRPIVSSTGPRSASR